MDFDQFFSLFLYATSYIPPLSHPICSFQHCQHPPNDASLARNALLKMSPYLEDVTATCASSSLFACPLCLCGEEERSQLDCCRIQTDISFIELLPSTFWGQKKYGDWISQSPYSLDVFLLLSVSSRQKRKAKCNKMAFQLSFYLQPCFVRLWGRGGCRGAYKEDIKAVLPR